MSSPTRGTSHSASRSGAAGLRRKTAKIVLTISTAQMKGGIQMVCDLLQKLELLHATGTQINPVHGQEIVQTFYDLLTVLDSKGLALLAFDGIVVAATTFAAEKGGVFHRRGLARWLAILILILSLSGAALCLWVSEISYPFFHYVACSPPDRIDFSSEITRLATLVEWRTAYYQIAWWCSIIAIPLFFFMFWGSLSWKNHTSYEPPKV